MSVREVGEQRGSNLLLQIFCNCNRQKKKKNQHTIENNSTTQLLNQTTTRKSINFKEE